MKKYPNYTIRAIADESGFNSAPILYNLFKKKTGMTPYEFKKAAGHIEELNSSTKQFSFFPVYLLITKY